MMGRPTKRTPAVERSILGSLRAGMTRTASAESAGVPRETLSRWMARNVTFRHAVLEAEAQAEIRATVTLRQAGEKDWRAALAWLERRRSADWGKVDRVEVEIRKVAERVARETGADPDWLVRRAVEIVATAERGES